MTPYLLAIGLNVLAAAAVFYIPELPRYAVGYLSGAVGTAIIVVYECGKAVDHVYHGGE